MYLIAFYQVSHHFSLRQPPHKNQFKSKSCGQWIDNRQWMTTAMDDLEDADQRLQQQQPRYHGPLLPFVSVFYLHLLLLPFASTFRFRLLPPASTFCLCLCSPFCFHLLFPPFASIFAPTFCLLLPRPPLLTFSHPPLPRLPLPPLLTSASLSIWFLLLPCGHLWHSTNSQTLTATSMLGASLGAILGLGRCH